MKYLLLLFIIISGFLRAIYAQDEQPFKNKLLEEYRKKRLSTDGFQLKPKGTLPPGVNIPPATTIPEKQKETPSVIKLPLKGKYLGENKAGAEIYAVEPDDMPCLVPAKAFRSNMPVVENKNKQEGLPFKNNKLTPVPEKKN